MAQLSYSRHRFPAPIIQHAIWLYLRFTLSYRDVEELLAECGLDISSTSHPRSTGETGSLPSGTEGSNPCSSTDESIANLILGGLWPIHRSPVHRAAHCAESTGFRQDTALSPRK